MTQPQFSSRMEALVAAGIALAALRAQAGWEGSARFRPTVANEGLSFPPVGRFRTPVAAAPADGPELLAEVVIPQVPTWRRGRLP
jgi:hypothetical protein